MNRVLRLILISAAETPRLFFAPLIGAYKGIKQEYRIVERENDKKRSTLGF